VVDEVVPNVPTAHTYILILNRPLYLTILFFQRFIVINVILYCGRLRAAPAKNAKYFTQKGDALSCVPKILKETQIFFYC
jgi:hypothetical protein